MLQGGALIFISSHGFIAALLLISQNHTTNNINHQRPSMGKRNSDMEGLQTILETLGIIAILFIFFLYMMSLGSKNLKNQ